MSRRARRVMEARQRQNVSSRGRTDVPQLEIQGPFTAGQAERINEHGYKSLEAYRLLLYRLRFGGGAERLLQTSMDWRIGIPVPPTAWFVERDHFRGIRNMDLSDVERVRIHLRAEQTYPGSILVQLAKNEHGIGLQGEFLFEHNDLETMERYTVCLPYTDDGWHGYSRKKSSDDWAEVDIRGEESP